MSAITGGPPHLGDGTVAGPAQLPYAIFTDYGNQLMTVIVDGTWTAQVPPDSSITMTATPNPADPTQTAIQFCFKTAMPGASTSATLTDPDGNQYLLQLSVPPL
jgi:hypothetical protein